MSMRPLFLALAIVLCIRVSAAEGATGPYLGMALGAADFSREMGTAELHDFTRFAWGVQVGWQAHKHLALEIGYLRPRSVHRDSLVVPLQEPSRLERRIVQPEVWTASALLLLPVGDRLSLRGRIGGASAKDKGKVFHNQEDEPAFEYSNRDSGLLFGVGVGVSVADTTWNLDYQRADVEEGDFGLLTLSVNWLFAR